ncbi:MAG: hypothetical protein ACRCX8_13855 [Sarcina sp.]
MASNKFNELAKASEKKRDLLTRKLSKEINSLYQGLYRELNKKLSKMPSNASEAYLRSIQKELGKEIVRINKKILTSTKKAIKESSELGTSMQLNFFSELSQTYDLGIEEAIWQMCATVHTDVIAEIVGGKIYKDRLGLSERIWSDTKRFEKDIDKVISEGLAQKKGTYDIAKDLEKYLNPKAKEVIYNGVRGQANYNTYRIAHTSIIHSYQQAAKRSAQKNPYVEGMKWISAHDKRACELCSERDGQVYLPKDMPLDHPMGRCTFTYDIPMSLEDIGTELSAWRKGEANGKLDNWFKDYGEYFI